MSSLDFLEKGSTQEMEHQYLNLILVTFAHFFLGIIFRMKRGGVNLILSLFENSVSLEGGQILFFTLDLSSAAFTLA